MAWAAGTRWCSIRWRSVFYFWMRLGKDTGGVAVEQKLCLIAYAHFVQFEHAFQCNLYMTYVSIDYKGHLDSCQVQVL